MTFGQIYHFLMLNFYVFKVDFGGGFAGSILLLLDGLVWQISNILIYIYFLIYYKKTRHILYSDVLKVIERI